LKTLIAYKFSESVGDKLAKATGLVKRTRKLSGYGLLNALSFSFNNQAKKAFPI
jgi:hypothetical protein